MFLNKLVNKRIFQSDLEKIYKLISSHDFKQNFHDIDFFSCCGGSYINSSFVPAFQLFPTWEFLSYFEI